MKAKKPKNNEAFVLVNKKKIDFKNYYYLSKKNDLKQSAKNLYSVLRTIKKEIQQSIPNWFIKLPKGTEKVLYVRGTAVVDTLQGSIDSATNSALRELGKKLETRLNSKIKETVRQAGVGEDQVTKEEV